MTTLKQVKRLAQPLLASNPDLVLSGRAIVIRPMNHLLRCIFVDRTSRATTARVVWMVIPLFRSAYDYYYHFGDELHAEHPPWHVSRLGMEYELQASAEAVLTTMRPVRTIAEFEAFALGIGKIGKPYGGEHIIRCYLDAALGRFESSLAHLEVMRANPKFFREGREDLHDKLMAMAAALEAGDRKRISAFLHECEAYTVKQLKLEKLWQPSPFPIELEGQ